MASTGREVILESHLPVLTHIAQMVNTEIDVESLAAYLLANISPFGAKFVASARNEKKEFHMIALEAMRKWCDSVNKPTGSALLKIFERINRQDIVRKFKDELTGGPEDEQTASYGGMQERESLEKDAVRPDVLTDISNGLSSKWECVQLAVRLGLTDDYVRRMQGQPFTDDFGFQMLLKWQGQNADCATGEALYHALKDIGRKDLAHRYHRQLDC